VTAPPAEGCGGGGTSSGRPQVVTTWEGLPEALRGTTVALGNFDGVHRGHAAVLRAAHAARPDLPLAALTFEPHPREHFRPDDPPFRLTLAETKVALLGALGAQVVYVIPFTAEFAAMPAEAFVEEVLHRGIGAKHLACGVDFAFGHRRGGDVALLAREAERRGIGLSAVPHLSDAGGPISSTRIRRALQDGYPERATEMLGRPWEVRGRVEHGDKIGRTLGWPTANMWFGRQLEPARGVYAVRVVLPDGTLRDGVANVGRRPTLGGDPQTRLETHIFDFEGDLYGREIGVRLEHFLRPDAKFADLEELKDAIAADAEEARRVLAAGPSHG